MSDPVTLEKSSTTAIIRMDDGKANALGPDVIAAIDAAINEAEKDRLAIVLAGREGKFSGGFDLNIMGAGGAAASAMVRAGGRLSLRLGRHPGPVVVACTGHAMAMGALLLLSADLRIGSSGPAKIAFNEVAIGTATPLFLLEQARERLSKRHFQRATVQSHVYDSASAIDAGFLDRLVEPDQVIAVATAEADRLATLPRGPFVETRARARRAILDDIEKAIDQDVNDLFGVSA